MFKRIWQLKSLDIVISNPVVQTEIVLCIKKNEEFPISGFPRTLQDEDLRSSKSCHPPFAIFSAEIYLEVGIRPTPSTANQRWRSRTTSQQNRRKKWTEPAAPLALMDAYDTVNSLSSYSRPDYLVGDSTPQALADARDRLGHDLAPMPVDMPVELSAVEGLIYEMMDTSCPVELEASIPVIVPQVIVEDEDAPSAHAMPRKPPKVYWSQDLSNTDSSQPTSASTAVPNASVEDYQSEPATAQNNDDFFYISTASPYADSSSTSANVFGLGSDYSSSRTTLSSRGEGLTPTTTFDSILEEQNNGAPHPKKAGPVKPTRKGFLKMFR
jgi:hypothetical protein